MMVIGGLWSTSVRKIGTAGLLCIIFGIIFRTVVLPSVLESRIRKKIALKKGWPMRETWSKFPHELRVYLFNVTNPSEIGNGEKPIVREVGPFVYDVWREKINEVDHEEDDTLSYNWKDTFFFNAEKSNGLSDEMELTLIHLIGIAMPIKILKVNPAVLTIVVKGIDILMGNPESIFIKFKVNTYLFGGLRFTCEKREEFFALAVCNDVKEHWFKYRMEKGDGYYASSVFGILNGTDFYNGKTRIRRGTRNIEEIGNVVEYNDMKNMSIWKSDVCDALIGTEGTMFHPFLDVEKEEVLRVTNTFYCRSFTYKYESDVKFAGLKLVRYTASVGSDMETNPNDKCFCLDKCLKDGVYELLKCLELSRIASNPHFYLADPYYSTAVDGLEPIKEKHLSIIDIDPLTGMVVRAHFRLQFNVQLTKIKKYRLMRNFPEALLPMSWFEEVTVLPDSTIKQIKNTYRMITVIKTLSYLMIFIGLAICGYVIFREYRLKKQKINVVKTLELEMKNNKANGS